MSSYLKARVNGDKNVYFIDGLSLTQFLICTKCPLIPAPPNDAGFIRMADAIGVVIRHILEKQSDAEKKVEN